MQVVLRRLGCMKEGDEEEEDGGEQKESENDGGNSGVIDMKGRVAAEISTADELLVCELVFNGIFNDLTPSVTAALCSCLVYNEKSSSDEAPPKLKEELAGPLRLLQDAAKRIAIVMSDARLNVDVEEYMNRFQPTLMEVVLAWCGGAKFSEICKLTDVFEGSIIRAMRRLEELLRQMAAASKSVGNQMLQQKFEMAIELLKRDIVFAASLYL